MWVGHEVRNPATDRSGGAMSTGTTRSMPRGRTALVPELMTVDEVAKALRLSRSKVYELIASRRLPAFRPGGRIRIPADAVRGFLRDSRV